MDVPNNLFGIYLVRTLQVQIYLDLVVASITFLSALNPTCKKQIWQDVVSYEPHQSRHPVAGNIRRNARWLLRPT